MGGDYCSFDDSHSICHLRKASYTSTQGDSGAPSPEQASRSHTTEIHRGVYSGDQSIRVFSTWFWTVFEVNSATGGSLTFG